MTTLTDAEREAITVAVLRYYGYTDADLAEAAQIHPGRVCDDDCFDREGEYVHPGVYEELHRTSAIVVDIIGPEIEALIAARLERQREALRVALVGKANEAWSQHNQYADEGQTLSASMYGDQAETWEAAATLVREYQPGEDT